MKTFPAYDLDALGVFHQDIEINENLRTSELSDPYHWKKTYSNHSSIAKFLKTLYKESLKEKTMLSTACNAGAQLFECQKIGIKEGYGFDVRELWIKQANWLKQNITSYNTDNLFFRTHGFDELTADKTYDVSFFDGIFYHLANPFLHLSKVASITNEIITVNTAYDSSSDSKPALIFKMEGKGIDEGLTGIEGVSWLPNDERVIKLMLQDLGFIEFKLFFKNPSHGRLCLIGSKKKGLLNNE